MVNEKKMGKAGGKALMAELEKANDKNAQVKKLRLINRKIEFLIISWLFGWQ